jgi:sugar phosphate isomerase/epimerase
MKNNQTKKRLPLILRIGSKMIIAALLIMPMIYSCNSTKESGSKFGGVQIGVITYSWRSMPGGIENIIKYCKETGVTAIELMSGDLEEYLGAPKNPMMNMFRQRPAAQPGAGAPPPAAATQPANAQPQEWRLSLPMSKFEEVRKMFEAEGISIHIVKFSPARWSDEEIDYAFEAAKAMGALGVTEELSKEAVEKLAPFAEKHGMYAIFHNHMQFAEPGFTYDTFVNISPNVMFNFDAGHFFGSTGIHPNEIIEKYHDRIFSVHLKDKTGPNTDPANMNQVWGQGEAPIEDILHLIQDNKWPIHCDIELEYDIKPWSDAVKEVKTCVKYARQILI